MNSNTTSTNITNVENMSINTSNLKINNYNYKSESHRPPFINFSNVDKMEPSLDVSGYSDECLRLTIGASGKNFKKITEENNMAYIWHNKETQQIEIWGDKNKFGIVKTQINNYLTWSFNYLYVRNNTL